ncbi:hypothetical protein RI367_001059 [Sorochytrium milnesiophthora]
MVSTDGMDPTFAIADMVFACGVAIASVLNILVARQFFKKARQSLGAWLSGAHIVSFVCGVAGGCMSLAFCVMRYALPNQLAAIHALDQSVTFFLIMQISLQAIVIIQRIHIVNAYVMDADAFTCTTLLIRRWPEILWTLGTAGMISIAMLFPWSLIEYVAATVWLSFVVCMDLCITFITFNKVHRMLNTGQTALRWLYTVWFPPKPSSPRPSPASSMPSATAGTSTMAASPFKQPSKLDSLQQRVLANTATRKIVRAWSLMTLSILGAIVLFFIAWYVVGGAEAWLPIFRLSWIFGCIWQRGSLMYIEAIKQVAITNRINKQYMGTITQTGIVYDHTDTTNPPSAAAPRRQGWFFMNAGTLRPPAQTDGSIDPLSTDTPSFLFWCFVVDFILSCGVVVAQSLNIQRARQFFAQKSLGAGLVAAHIAGFSFGIIGGIVSVAYCCVHFNNLYYPYSRRGLDQTIESSLQMQAFFQALIIVQRVHIVNAYKVDTDVITLQELLTKRWPEGILCLVNVGCLFAINAYGGTDVEYSCATGWLVFIVLLDLTVSLATFNKVHRMLNTGERAISWYWKALLPESYSGTLLRSKHARKTALTASNTPTIHTQTDSGDASNKGSTAKIASTPGPSAGMSLATRKVVRSWSLMTMGIIMAALVFIFSWIFVSHSQAYVVGFRLCWLLGCIWQRGGLLYIEAIRQVALTNRASKQYLGAVTATGIAYNTQAPRQAATII